GSLPQERLRRLMAGSDLLVHLTNCRLENYGLVVAEAMAAGLPVLAADWGGLRDLVIHGETGFLARTFLSAHGPRTDWLSALPWATGLLMDRGAWAAMSRRARHEAVETLDRQTYRRRLCSAVRAACDERTDGVLPGRSTLSPGGQELMFRT